MNTRQPESNFFNRILLIALDFLLANKLEYFWKSFPLLGDASATEAGAVLWTGVVQVLSTTGWSACGCSIVAPAAWQLVFAVGTKRFDAGG